MSQIWKNFRINLMYWRFRYITRNRLRFQSWYRRRQPARPRYRPRASATSVYHRSSGRAWIFLLALVVLLTAINVVGNHYNVGSGLLYAVSTLVVVLAIYLALRTAS